MGDQLEYVYHKLTLMNVLIWTIERAPGEIKFETVHFGNFEWQK